MQKSEQLFERAQKTIPGGVNSPVRAFKAVGGTPRFITKADGPYIVDADGKQYIDYVQSWGPMVLGHNNEKIRNAVVAAAQNGLSFGAPTEAEIIMAEKVKDGSKGSLYKIKMKGWLDPLLGTFPGIIKIPAFLMPTSMKIFRLRK